MIWSPIERDWLAAQLRAVLPAPPELYDEGVPLLLEAMPRAHRWGLRALVWWVAAASRARGPAVVLTDWLAGDSWLRRDAAAALKVSAALVWEADGDHLDALGWYDGPPRVLPEREPLLEATSERTFAPEELH